MDNASKALIMAGAILIAVALVSLGVYLYQSAASKVSDGTKQIDASQQLMLNAEIEKYEGQRRGSEVIQLIRTINADNINKIFPADLECNKDVDDIRTTATYNITVNYDDDGWVCGVTID